MRNKHNLGEQLRLFKGKVEEPNTKKQFSVTPARASTDQDMFHK